MEPLATNCELLTHFTVSGTLPNNTCAFWAKPEPAMVTDPLAPAVTGDVAEVIKGRGFCRVTCAVSLWWDRPCSWR